MKSIQFNANQSEWNDAIDKIKAVDPSFVVLMAGTDVLKNGDLAKSLSMQLPSAQIIGCSTSGEIGGKGVSDGGIEVAAARLESGRVKTVSETLRDAAESREIGARLGDGLNGADLKAVFVLSPGVNVNGSELVAGLRSKLPEGVVLTGGLAGDGTRFAETVTILNDGTHADRVVALGLYGDNLIVGAGSKGGWKPFGPARLVTKVEGNVLYELDGKPALELYKSYLGDRAAELPASGLLYPLAILRDDQSVTGLIRTILSVDHEKNSLVLAGDIPEGSRVCLMHADKYALAEGATEAAAEATGTTTPAEGESLSICVSCVGRRLVMGEDVDDEIDGARTVLGESGRVIGFYSYGEIAPFSETGQAELHNQTMTITHISEKAA